MAWTDERLDDLAHAMHAGFERVDRDIRGLRHEIRDVRRELGCLRGDVDALRMMMVRMTGGLVVGFAGVIATIAINGGGA